MLDGTHRNELTDFQAHLLTKFAAQRGIRKFIGIDLPAWEFPQPAKSFVRRTPCREDALIGIEQHQAHDIDDRLSIHPFLSG